MERVIKINEEIVKEISEQKIVVVGNGFDMSLEIKSSYPDFYSIYPKEKKDK